MRALKAGLLYFALVFGAGFVLGPIRILWLVPRLGTRMAEFILVLWLRGLTIDEYIATRDPVAGTLYLLMLGLFAMMPLLVARQ